MTEEAGESHGSSMIDTVKFIQDYTRNFVAEIQRLAMTLIIVYLAAPHLAEQIFNLSVSKYHSSVISVAQFLGIETTKDDHTFSIVVNVLILFVAFQLISALHLLVLEFFRQRLPTFYIKLYQIDRLVGWYRQRIQDLAFKYYSSKMNRDDFDLLFDMYRDKTISEGQAQLIARNDDDPLQVTFFVKEEHSFS